jgi:hypothetical protein
MRRHHGARNPGGDSRCLACAVSVADLHQVGDALHLVAQPLERTDLRTIDGAAASAETAAVRGWTASMEGSTVRCAPARTQRTLDTFCVYVGRLE